MNILRHTEKRGENVLQNDRKAVKLMVDHRGWVTCPLCRRNHRLMRVLPDTRAQNLEVFCRDCKARYVLNIEKGQRVELRS